MSRAFATYSAFLARRPFVGNMATSAALFATGDVIAQQLVEKRGRKHDLVRTAQLSAWGSLIFAPVVTVWFRQLQRIDLGSRAATTVARVGLDQFVAAPTIVAGFFTFMTLVQGKSLEDAQKKIETAWLPTLKANWGLFIPVQAINMLVPLQYRLLVINAVNIPWNTFLSIQNQKNSGLDVQAAKEVEKAL